MTTTPTTRDGSGNGNCSAAMEIKGARVKLNAKQ
jgi:hypothetical protein